MKDGKTITKARLVARGFEEQKNDTSMNDSPTCSKEVLRVSLTVLLHQSWSLNSMTLSQHSYKVKKSTDRFIQSHQKILLKKEKYGY